MTEQELKENFHVGQIFVGVYPPEAADFCNTFQYIIMEIEPEEETHKPRYQIQEIPAPSEEELLRSEFYQKEDFLRQTDWMIIRAADNGVAVPQEIRDARQAARVRIDEIRARLAEITEE